MKRMKKRMLLILFILIVGVCFGCNSRQSVDIAATTLPVYEFTSYLCVGTDITVGRIVTESVSCLHDYTLQVGQMQMIESAGAIVISGAGLEEFLDDALDGSNIIIDASEGAHVHSSDHSHDHDHTDQEHTHEHDPHIWLSPENAGIMAENICNGLSALYPEHKSVLEKNLNELLTELDALQCYGDETLSQLSCRELVTFHDGFAYFAESFDLTILRAVEEESGSEAAASELKELILLVDEHGLPAVFVESNGSVSAADIIAAETNTKIYTLDMAMGSDSYFDAMYHNIDTIKEALG